MDAADLSAKCKALSERMTLIRNKGAYGARPDRRLLSKIASWQPVSVHHFDEADDTFSIETVQNINPIFDACKERRLSGHDGYTSPARDFKHVACLPLVVVAKLFKQGINVYQNQDWPKVRALLDSPDWEAWRTGGGKLSKRPARQYFTRQGSRRTVEY